MLKLLGSLFILFGMAGALFSWEGRRREQIGRLEALSDFLTAAAYAMEAEHVSMIAYFSAVPVADDVLCRTVRDAGKLLEGRCVPTGEEAWERACKRHKKEWNLPEELWKTVLSCGQAFFGKTLAQNLEKSALLKKRLSGETEKQRQRFAEQKKICIPAGMLGGLMLLVLFL